MLARPRRWIRAGWPRTSRSCTFGTASRSASHAVLAPDLVIASAVITRPPLGAFDCVTPARPPPAAAVRHTTSVAVRKKRRGRSTPRPPSPHSSDRPSVHDGIRHDVLHRVDRLAVHPHLVVQVRAPGKPRRADFRDHLPTLHALAAHHENLRA